MSVKGNSIANYIGQSYQFLIGVTVTPLYLGFLGADSYGLVGFFALLQAWMGLLDMGLVPTLGRQAAFASGVDNGFEFFKRLLKSLELIFLGLAILIIVSIFLASEWIATSWVTSKILPTETIVYCIKLMGVMIGLRWYAALYRSGINGLEDQVWLNAANIAIITLKFLGALFLLSFISNDISRFFEYQLFIGLVEVLVLLVRFYRKLPATKISLCSVSFNWQAVKSVAPFSLSIAYTSGIWILVTQSDKLILSGVLNLSEFGYFSLVALVAGSITTLSGPISKAILPRMTTLFAQGKIEEMTLVYRQASHIVTLISFSVAMIFGLFSEKLLYAWTGDTKAAEWGAEVLLWFALGNGALAIEAFQYYLQSAFGQLRLHVIGSSISAVIQLPIIFWAAINYGVYGAGIAWFSIRIIWFIWWTPIIHNKFLPGFHLQWLFKEILPIIVTITFLGWIVHNNYTFSLETHRFLLFVQMALIGIFLLSLSALSIPVARLKLLQMFRG